LHSSRTDTTLPLFMPPGERITGTLTEELRLTWHMPMRRNPLFTGRETILTLLREQLTSHRSMALTQVQAISGLGGIGKTQIAVEYAYRYRELYSHVFWVRAATSSDLLADFVSIAQTLTLADGDEPNQYLVALSVKRWLETHDGWLLILDNADDLSTITNFMPQSTRGHIVLTTRAQATGIVAQALDVEKMDLQEGVLLLLRRAKRLQPGGLQEQVQPLHRAEAEAIVRELDGLPLALDQAGAYIEEKQCSLSTYLSLYRTHRKALLLRRSTMPSDHPEPVAATWQLSFRSVEQNQPAAADLLCLCAFLDPDAIPEALLLQGAELGTVLGPIVTDTFMLNEAIEELLKYSLVRRNADAQLLSVHRLVQAVLRDEMDATTLSRWMARCIQLLNHIFPAGTMLVEQWEWCEQLVPHVLKSTTFNVQWENSLEAAALFHKTASYLFDRVRYGEAEPLFVHTLHIKERVLGLYHPEVALSLYHLGSLYYEQANYEEAEPLFVRALTIWEQASDVDHSQIAYPLNGLADLYYEQGKYEEAEPLYARALSIREQTSGHDYVELAHPLSGLANLHRRQGKYEEAEPLSLRALSIREQALGLNHPEVAHSLNHLANLYYEWGKYERAEPLSLRALQMLEKALGPDHSDVARSLNPLAGLYAMQGKHEEAEALFLRALRIQERALGPDHPKIAFPLNGLASLYVMQERYEEAEALFLRALRVREQALGPDYPKVVYSLNGLADLYSKQGRYEEAEPLFVRALTVREQSLGSRHPHMAETIHAFALFHHDQGHLAEARILYQRALAIRETILGSQNPYTRETLSCYIALLHQAGQLDEAALLEARLQAGMENGASNGN
jgi:tetratricopeptide (TPR) repeat protein